MHRRRQRAGVTDIYISKMQHKITCENIKEIIMIYECKTSDSKHSSCISILTCASILVKFNSTHRQRIEMLRCIYVINNYLKFSFDLNESNELNKMQTGLK